MFRRPYDSIIVMSAALIAAAAVLVDLPTGIARVIGAMALVLVLPGYSLSKLLPAGLQSSWWARFVFTVGLSMASTVLGGLLLNLTPWGIRSEGWIAWLCGVTLVASGLALARRQSVPNVEDHGFSIDFGPHGASLLITAFVVGTLAMAIAWWGAFQQSGANATQLWLLADEPAGPQTIRLGIRNLEATTKTYRLVLMSGDRVITEWHSITLAPAQQWKTVISMPSDGARSQTAEALLYVKGSEAVYRRALLYLGAPSGELTPSSGGIGRSEASGGN